MTRLAFAALAGVTLLTASPAEAQDQPNAGDRRSAEQVLVCEVSARRRGNDLVPCLVERYRWESDSAAVAQSRIQVIARRFSHATAQIRQELAKGALRDSAVTVRTYTILDSLRAGAPPYTRGFEQLLEVHADSLANAMIGPRPSSQR